MHRRSLERGQAMSEYIVLYPIAIGVMIVASAAVAVILNGLQRTVDVFQPRGVVPMECVDDGPSLSGTTIAYMGDHIIEVTAVVYNETDDTTTVTYSVTSGPKPSISHWVLGLSPEIADQIISTSEPIVDYSLDPRTGMMGVKFDIGYESTGSDDGGGGNGGGNGGGGGKGKGGKVMDVIYEGKFFPTLMSTTNVDSGLYRDVTLLFSGQYDFGDVDVAIKAGLDIHTSVILAPITVYQSSCN